MSQKLSLLNLIKSLFFKENNHSGKNTQRTKNVKFCYTDSRALLFAIILKAWKICFCSGQNWKLKVWKMSKCVTSSSSLAGFQLGPQSPRDTATVSPSVASIENHHHRTLFTPASTSSLLTPSSSSPRDKTTVSSSCNVAFMYICEELSRLQSWYFH